MLAARDFPPEHHCRKLCSGFRNFAAARVRSGLRRSPSPLCGETGRFRLLQSHVRELQGKKPAEYIDWPWVQV